MSIVVHHCGQNYQYNIPVIERGSPMPIPERVILIKGDENKWYDQAIFIINPTASKDKLPLDFVAEAERIINGYMDKSRRPASPAVSSFAPGPGSGTALALPSQSTTATVAPAAKKPARRSGSDLLLNVLMILGCLAIALLFIYGVAM